MKIYYTNTYTIMIGLLTINGMSKDIGDQSKKTLFAANLDEKLYSTKCKCQVFIDPKIWTKSHVRTIDFSNSHI